MSGKNKISDLYIREGANKSLATIGTSATLLLDPSLNVRGAVVKTAFVSCATASQVTAIVSATSAPAAWNTAGNGVILGAVMNNVNTGQNLSVPVYIPPGRGVYGISSAAPGGVAAITYDYL